MAQDFQRIHTGPVLLEGIGDALVKPKEVASKLRNFYRTDENSLRSNWGPVEYHPSEWLDDGGATAPIDTDYDASNPYGLFHAMVGTRSILLRHASANIKVHNGSAKTWDNLVGASLDCDWVDDSFSELNDQRPKFLTQFVSTPDGVVMVPQGGRAYFYDGVVVLPLGYSEAPGAPTPHGPRASFEEDSSTSDDADVANTEGYAHSGRIDNLIMGSSRIGTITNAVIDIATTGKSNPLGGVLEAGEWRRAVQFIDYWGNLSPIGPLSAPLKVAREDNLTKDRRRQSPESSDRLRIQGAWSGISKGRDGTVGRVMLGTRDTLNSGIPGLFEIPLNSGEGALAFATIPDNVCEIFPDNTPDTWLLVPATKVSPMPIFKIAFLAFGRLWVANTQESPGVMQASYPGRWGTLDPTTKIYPDATGKEITGGVMTERGCLVFTRSSTFILMPNDSGNGFRSVMLHASLGCVSPDSIAVMPNGAVVWLSDSGFVAFDGSSVIDISISIRKQLSRINPVWAITAQGHVDPHSREYRCWVPIDDSKTCNMCFIFDGKSWRESDYIEAEASCVTKDDRQYTLVYGKVKCDRTDPNDSGNDYTDTLTRSVWVLDHDGLGILQPNVENRTAVIETAWLKMGRSYSRSSPRRVELWLRETNGSNITVEVYRDGRDAPAVNTVSNVSREPKDDIHEKWGATALDADVVDKMLAKGSRTRKVNWSTRRTFWSKVSIVVPSCETFKLKITGTGDWDFMGFRFSENGGNKGGAPVPGRG